MIYQDYTLIDFCQALLSSSIMFLIGHSVFAVSDFK